MEGLPAEFWAENSVLWTGGFLDGEGTYTLHGVKTSDLFYVICDKSCFIRADLFLSLNLFGNCCFSWRSKESVGGFG